MLLVVSAKNGTRDLGGIMIERIYTKKAMHVVTVRLPRRDRELLRLAATKEEISQSEFIRLALRDRGTQVIGESEPNRAA